MRFLVKDRPISRFEWPFNPIDTPTTKNMTQTGPLISIRLPPTRWLMFVRVGENLVSGIKMVLCGEWVEWVATVDTWVCHMCQSVGGWARSVMFLRVGNLYIIVNLTTNRIQIVFYYLIPYQNCFYHIVFTYYHLVTLHLTFITLNIYLFIIPFDIFSYSSILLTQKLNLAALLILA